MKITKEDLLNSEFLKQFKDSGELDGFLWIFRCILTPVPEIVTPLKVSVL
jgi:hypothetical protein